MAEKKQKLVEIKTKPTAANVYDFINDVPDKQKREDCMELLQLMKEETGAEPVLWSSSIIGFGNKIYTSPKTGRQVDWLLVGFSPRKANLSLHLMLDLNKNAAKLARLGKHKSGAGCIYVNKLADIDLAVLRELVQTSLQSK